MHSKLIKSKVGLAALLLASVSLVSPITQSAEIESATLAKILQRGRLVCGVNANLPGFSTSNSLGEYTGLDVDLCRAISAAIFNGSEKTEFIPTTATDRFNDLINEEFDVLIRNTTWTLGRNSSFGNFAGVNFYDGQGFLVWKHTRIRSSLELDNVTICVSRGTTSELNAADYFTINKLRYAPEFHDDEATAIEAYVAGKCDALTTDRSALAATRISQPDPNAHLLLADIISKEPLGPMVRANDTGWENVVRWSLNCMINAEEIGVDSTNVDSIDDSALPSAQRLAGLVGDFGTKLGLNNSWCADIIRSVGNYGESYDRNVGDNSRLQLQRGVNSLWTDGGLIYAPPIR